MKDLTDALIGMEFSEANNAYELAPIKKNEDGDDVLDWDNELCITAGNDELAPRRLVACWNIMQGVPLGRFEGKTLFQYVTGEAYLANMLPTDEGVSLGLTGLATQMLAASFAGQFKGTGATNFLEVGMHHPEIGEFTVTIQRKQGKTPSQLKAEADAKCAKLLAMIERVIDAEYGFGERGAWPTEGELRNLVVEVSQESGTVGGEL